MSAAVSTPTQYVPAEAIQPGQVIAYADKPRALVLRVNESYVERVGPLAGREIKAHWCRILDGDRSGEEGWVPFGPGGQLPVAGGGRWQPANNGAGQHRWFLARDTDNGTEYHDGANGRLVRYGSYESARRAADRLNGVSA